MTNFLKTLGSAALLSIAMMPSAFADVGDLPEPGSLSLMALAAGAAVFFLRRKK